MKTVKIEKGDKFKRKGHSIVIVRTTEKSIFWKDERWDDNEKSIRCSKNTVIDLINEKYWIKI